VLQPKGRIDGSNYQEVIAAARSAYQAGARDFLLDLSAVDYISSAGLVAMHTVAMFTRLGLLPEEENGWEAFRAIDREKQGGPQPHLKLLGPQPRVEKVLTMAGMDQYLEVFTDLETAVNAF
jgi:anti-anti-sigma regulatory factor